MNFQIEIKQYRKHLSLPCQIIDNHLKLASSDAIKVIIYILYSEKENFTSEEIASKTGVSTYSVEEAIFYWERAEILKTTSKSNENIAQTPTTNEISIEEKIEILPKVEKSPETTTEIPKKKAKALKYTPREIEKRISEESELKFLTEAIQQAFKRPITYTEQVGIVNFFEYYHLPASVILILVEYCISIDKGSVHYMEKIAASWAENGINTHILAENEIINMEKKSSYEGQVRKALFLETNLTPTQKEYISKWISMGISIDMITFSSEKCIDAINKLSFPYMDKILHNWTEKGYKLRIDVKDSKNNYQVKNSTESSHSYDLNEFMQMAVNNTPQFSTNNE